MPKSLKYAVAFTALMTLLVASFAGGVYFDRTRRGVSPFSGSPVETIDTVDMYDALDEVIGIIEREALEPANETSITAGAIRGLLEGLGDEHALYFDAQHFEYFNEQNAGSFFGVGVTISNRDDALVIISVMDGTPADKAGLKAEDIILEIDGEYRDNWNSDEAVMRIRGEEGTEVTIGVYREGEDEILDFTMKRAKIDVPNIESEMLADGIGYIRLYSFNEVAEEDIRSAIEKLEGEGARGFVLDLRDNPGGLLGESIDVASLFVADGVIVRVEDREGEGEEYRATGDLATDAPLVVLINGNSASASEIVGGALQDYSRAVLVGEVSFGKGSVQTIEPLSFGGAVKLTIAHYLTPKGQVIDKKGLTPDIVVEMEPELQSEKDTDTQLQRAIEELKGLL
jgi:carboxyl-terminal processing protease